MQIKIEGSDECEVREGERELLAGSFFLAAALGAGQAGMRHHKTRTSGEQERRKGKAMKNRRTRKGINRG